MPPRLRLAITVDVEEEGLFTGRYPREPAGVANVSSLRRVEFIPREFSLPLTLLTTYQVARDPAAGRILRAWRENLGAEIGAHLHPWNTPPFLPGPEPRWVEELPGPLLADKLATLRETLMAAFGQAPLSFRMGRFAWGPKLLSLLPRFGLALDSSMVPLTQVIGGPDHFLAPLEPFRVSLPERDLPVVEAPLTLVPLLPRLPRLIYRLSRRLPPPWSHASRAWFPFLAAAGVQPTWYPLSYMRWAVRLHARRGGRTLVMFFHSSELFPGGTPHFPTEARVRQFLRKLRRFLRWLTTCYEIDGVTLSALAAEARQSWPPRLFLAETADLP